MTEPPRILLIGMMGAGKTTVGRLLAARLGWPLLDSDDEIEKRTGRTVPEIWKADGEAAFRVEESAVLAEACASSQPAVVAVAGGAVIDPANRELVRRGGLVVWLRAKVPTLGARVGSGAGRPLLEEDPVASLSRLYQHREPIYSDLAELTFDVDRLSPAQVVDRIAEAIGR